MHVHLSRIFNGLRTAEIISKIHFCGRECSNKRKYTTIWTIFCIFTNPQWSLQKNKNISVVTYSITGRYILFFFLCTDHFTKKYHIINIIYSPQTKYNPCEECKKQNPLKHHYKDGQLLMEFISKFNSREIFH